MKTGSLLCFVLLMTVAVHAQKVIVVMGSSTAAGSGATVYDSAWVGRLTHYYRQNINVGNPDTVVQNLGFFGATTYQEMPTGFVSSVPNRPAPNENINVTKALSFHPDIVIINLPNNDIVNLVSPSATPHEIMDNFRIMYQAITATGAKCFITTSQPRNDINTTTNFFQRQQLRALVDSINNAFGLHAINFWDDLVSTDGLYSLRDDVRDPASDYHLNNKGHRLVYERVVAKSIFSIDAALPLALTHFTARLAGNNIQLLWHTDAEDAATSFRIQYSTDGNRFETLATQTGRGSGDYNWTDPATRTGKNFYRLQIVSPNKSSFSKILAVNGVPPLSISQIYLRASQLHAEVYSARPQAASCSIVDMNGVVVMRRSEQLSTSINTIELALDRLPAGAYLLRIVAGDILAETRRFTLLK
jgi:lysophospholipase L1-like esterase